MARSSTTRIPRPWLEQQHREMHTHHRMVAAKSKELNAPVWDAKPSKKEKKEQQQDIVPLGGLGVLWKKLCQGFCPPGKEQESTTQDESSHQFPPPSPMVIYAVPPGYGPYHSSPTGGYGPPWPAASHQLPPYSHHYMDAEHHQQYHHHPHHPPAMMSRSDRLYSINSQWTDASGGSFVRVPQHRNIPSPRRSSLKQPTNSSQRQRARTTSSSCHTKPKQLRRRCVSDSVARVAGKPPLYNTTPSRKNSSGSILERSSTVGSTTSYHSRQNATLDFDWNELYLPPDDESSSIVSIGTISTKETRNTNKANWMMEWASQGPSNDNSNNQSMIPPTLGVTWADQQQHPTSPPPPPPPVFQVLTTTNHRSHHHHHSSTSHHHHHSLSSPSTLVYSSSASTTASPSSSSWSSSLGGGGSSSASSSSLSTLSPVSPYSNKSNSSLSYNNNNNNNHRSFEYLSPPSTQQKGRRNNSNTQRRRPSEHAALTYFSKNRKLEQLYFSKEVVPPLVSGWVSYTLGRGSCGDGGHRNLGYLVILPTCNTLYLYPSSSRSSTASTDDNNASKSERAVSDEHDYDENNPASTTVRSRTTSTDSGGSSSVGSKSSSSSSKSGKARDWIRIPMLPEKKSYVEMKMISPAVGKAVLVKNMMSGDTLVTLLPVGLDDNNKKVLSSTKKEQKKKATTTTTTKSSIAPVAQHDAALHLLFALDGWIRSVTTDGAAAGE
eukprot:CAMPEP_0194041710 /NCGR_PEP_ID=MMETSP0009_2-20130614/13567_1 /TAXON_ID=210454 /ORGANISM="Grammatophora oceanica, Strain CCMP 410" /LENGTH=718 /DNA_ID=CAMNT_0038685299 /DNA_START=94 /DNA_END=2250 /DNA_ORIENTATION=+